MNVDLAFTPQSHWTHQSIIGSANGAFANISLFTPEKFWRRKLYASFRSDTGSNYVVDGFIRFRLKQRLMLEMPWRRTSTGGGNPPELFFQVAGVTQTGVDVVRSDMNSVIQNIFPHNFTVACDTISVEWNISTTSGGAIPMSFFGVLSSNLW
jgi:hypothetical protein